MAWKIQKQLQIIWKKTCKLIAYKKFHLRVSGMVDETIKIQISINKNLKVKLLNLLETNFYKMTNNVEHACIV